MDKEAMSMTEARQMINKLSLVCRQTITFLDGKSAMDERRIKRALQDAVTESTRLTMRESNLM